MAITAYDRQFNFQNQQALTPAAPLPAQQVDAEYNAIKITLDAIIGALAAITRDDGELANASVGRDQLDPDALIAFDDVSPWATATFYLTGANVFSGTGFYRATITHTSGVFATDLAADKWELLFDFSDLDVQGPAGWSPVFSVVTDSARRVLKIVDWQGGEGDEPAINKFVGASGLVDAVGDGVDIRGATGVGDTGWSPVFGVASNALERVFELVGWEGGSGSLPSELNDLIGQYLGPAGFVVGIGDAVDIRGPAGSVADIGFIDITDVPAAYTGHGGKLVTVKAAVDGLEFTDFADYIDAYIDADGRALTGPNDIPDEIAFSGVISPTLSGDQNNWSPTGWNDDPDKATGIRAGLGGANRVVTGLAGGSSGRLCVIHNNSFFRLTLANESASSTAANRFSVGVDFVLPAGKMMVLQYDGTSSRWRSLGVLHEQVFMLTGYIASPADGDIEICPDLPWPVTFVESAARLASGTLSLTPKVDTTALGGGAIAVTSTKATLSHTTTNTAVAGDKFVLTVASASSPVGLSYRVTYKRLMT